MREAKLAAVNEETAKRLSAAARQAEHAAAAAAAELQRLEDELKQVGDVLSHVLQCSPSDLPVISQWSHMISQ